MSVRCTLALLLGSAKRQMRNLGRCPYAEMKAHTTHAIGDIEVAVLIAVKTAPLLVHQLSRRELPTTDAPLNLHSVNVAREDQIAIAESRYLTP